MSTLYQSRTPIIWCLMRKLNRRVAIQAIGRGRGPRGVVLLLTTTGRKSGQPRVTPLQYEEDQGVIYVAAARGRHADWFRNIQANSHVKVQIADRVLAGLAEPIVEPARIADFLELRLRHHRLMMRLLFMAEGLPPWADRAALERFAASKALVAIRLITESVT